jgi:uncharacterized protein YdhG (YjbR/CyaY superfamily)
MQKYDTVDEYINSLPDRTKEELTKLRAMIKNLVPDTNESMSYGMPGYKLNNKPLIYFAGWKDHIGFYPTPNGMNAFEKELAPYKTGKGTAQFPLDKPVPHELISNIIKFRVEQIKNS